MKRIKIDEQERLKLESLVRDNNTYRQVMLGMGVNDSSAGYKYLKRRIVAYGIDDSHFLSRSEVMKQKWNAGLVFNKQNNEDIFTLNSPTSRHLVKSRLIEGNIIEYKCVFCGNIGEWRNKKIALVLDHKNGISNDNRIENLRFVCPNCNATLATHCIGAKGLVAKNKKIEKRRQPRPYRPRFHKRKVERPDPETLKQLIAASSFVAVAKKFGVSDNAIRKWCKHYHLL